MIIACLRSYVISINSKERNIRNIITYVLEFRKVHSNCRLNEWLLSPTFLRGNQFLITENRVANDFFCKVFLNFYFNLNLVLFTDFIFCAEYFTIMKTVTDASCLSLCSEYVKFIVLFLLNYKALYHLKVGFVLRILNSFPFFSFESIVKG